MRDFVVRQMAEKDLNGVVALQPLAFPPPFPQDYHWDADSLSGPTTVFPEGQWVAECEGKIVASCCNTIISEAQWAKHANWWQTVGGVELREFDPNGSTLYGLDIAVHPSFRRMGIGRAFYQRRYHMVRERNLTRYGTACRIPDYRSFATLHPRTTPEQYVDLVVKGEHNDRTLSPLLRMGMTHVGLIHDYMQDFESADCGALLEWLP